MASTGQSTGSNCSRPRQTAWSSVRRRARLGAHRCPRERRTRLQDRQWRHALARNHDLRRTEGTKGRNNPATCSSTDAKIDAPMDLWHVVCPPRTSPRHAPASRPRRSTTCLKRCRSPSRRAVTKPSASPTFSMQPSGSWRIVTSTRLESSPCGVKTARPWFGLPEVLSRAMTTSGTCSVISAIHCTSLPPISAFQCR